MKTYDAITKQIIDRFSGDWTGLLAERVGLPEGAVVAALDSDLSTVFSIQADKLFQVSGTADGLIHLEVLSSWMDGAADTALAYNASARKRYGGPVRSVLLLLRREAFSSDLTGLLTDADEDGEYVRFRYRVLKLWEAKAEPLLNGPVGTLPLVVLTDEARPRLTQLMPQIAERIRNEVTSTTVARELLDGCGILLGLRYNEDEITRILRGVTGMQESSYYQLILKQGEEKGKVAELHRMLEKLGTKKLGKLRKKDRLAIQSITDLDRLERMTESLFDAADWDEVIATP